MRSAPAAGCVIAVLAACCAAAASHVVAQGYPARPIRMIVTSAPGGGADFMARAAAQRLTEALGQPLIVDNRPGIASQAGNEFGMGATPDGYTVTIASPGYTINSTVRASKFDPLTSYTPIIMVGKGPLVVLTHPSVPARNAKELIAVAKSRPGELAYGTGGQGTITHLMTALFLVIADVKMLQVSYKGGSLSLVDLLAGRLQVVFTPPQTGMPYVRSGKLRAIGVTTAERSKSEPEIPTLAESGVPGYEASNWHALIAPKGLPRPIQERLNAEMNKIVASPDFTRTLLSHGVEPAGGTPAELHEYVRRDFYKWRKVVQDANIEDRVSPLLAMTAGVVANAPADGYTFVMITSNHTVPTNEIRIAYDPLRSFTPIIEIAYLPSVLVVVPALRVNSVRELIDLAKARPRTLNFGSAGPGTAQFMDMHLMMQTTGISMVNITYKGAAPTVIALLGNEIQLTLQPITSPLESIRSGRLKALAVMGRTRSRLLPDVPAASEVAAFQGFEGSANWYGIVGPAGTPRAIVSRLHRDVTAAIDTPEVQRVLSEQGFVLVAGSPEQFATHIAADLAKWSRLWKSLDVK